MPSAGEDRALDLEIRFLTTGRDEEVTALRSGHPAVQRLVVVNSGSRPYDYHAWTTVGQAALSYPQSTSGTRAVFDGRVEFERGRSKRGVEHFEEVVYEAPERTQPTHVAITKGLNVGEDSDGGWTRITLGSDYVECRP